MFVKILNAMTVFYIISLCFEGSQSTNCKHASLSHVRLSIAVIMDQDFGQERQIEPKLFSGSTRNKLGVTWYHVDIPTCSAIV